MPFTVEQFLAVFAQYNQAVWPMQAVLVLAASAAIGVAFTQANRVVAFLLAGLWWWTGDVYHWLFFSRVNRAAWLFGLLFMTQGALFFLLGVVRKELRFQVRGDARGILGGLFIVYALLLYPMLGQMLGHVYPAAPTFGAPCPVMIFTFGRLLWLEGKVKWWLLVIPLLWSLLGMSAAVSLGMREDFALPLAGLITVALIVQRNRKLSMLCAGCFGQSWGQ